MNLYDTITLMGVVQQLKPFDPFLLDLFFPTTVNFHSRSIAIDKVAADLKLAPFVSPMVAGKAQKAKGHETLTFDPAYLKPKDVVDPERLLNRIAGEGIGGVLTPAQRRDAIIADIMMDHLNKIRRRFEWMAAQALLTGKVVVEGDDYPAVEVDFQRKASLTKTLSGASRWGQSGVVPADDLETWAAEAEAPVTTVVMDQLAWKLFRSDPETRELLDTRRGSRSQMELGPNNGRHISFKGTIGADLEIWVYSGTYEDESGTHKFLPDNSVVMGSGAVEGVRAFGAILSPSNGYEPMEYYPRHFVSQEVELEYIESQSAPLMIPGRPDATVAITVN
ncbi:MAG: major capsid protein [Halioglobus sp.]